MCERWHEHSRPKKRREVEQLQKTEQTTFTPELRVEKCDWRISFLLLLAHPSSVVVFASHQIVCVAGIRFNIEVFVGWREWFQVNLWVESLKYHRREKESRTTLTHWIRVLACNDEKKVDAWIFNSVAAGDIEANLGWEKRGKREEKKTSKIGKRKQNFQYIKFVTKILVER